MYKRQFYGEHFMATGRPLPTYDTLFCSVTFEAAHVAFAASFFTLQEPLHARPTSYTSFPDETPT
jgi:hypothetical protein